MDNKVLREAIQRYGNEKQLDMVIEECTELIQAICKNKRGKDNNNNIAKKIANVEIMIEQLKIIKDICNTEVEICKQHKINRLALKLRADGV